MTSKCSRLEHAHSCLADKQCSKLNSRTQSTRLKLVYAKAKLFVNTTNVFLTNITWIQIFRSYQTIITQEKNYPTKLNINYCVSRLRTNNKEMPFDVRHSFSITSGKGIVNYLCWSYPLTISKHSRAKKHIHMRKCLKFEPSYIIKIFNNFNNNG